MGLGPINRPFGWDPLEEPEEGQEPYIFDILYRLRRPVAWSPAEGVITAHDVYEVAENSERAERYNPNSEQLIHHTPRCAN